MEHTCWITPSNMNEICRRTKTQFVGYYKMTVLKSQKWYWKSTIVMKFLPNIFSSLNYVYIIQKLS